MYESNLYVYFLATEYDSYIIFYFVSLIKYPGKTRVKIVLSSRRVHLWVWNILYIYISFILQYVISQPKFCVDRYSERFTVLFEIIPNLTNHRDRVM